ncbi:MAG TPA: GAF domain-containing protein [Opitutaceae bacterium]|jgi:signal transduction histidine kinase|nr:GAF domain-containing protein [Opitutaceae bacterium]
MPTANDPRTLSALYNISSLLGKTEDAGTTLRAILAEIIAYFDASSGSIALLNPDSGRLEIEVQQGLPDDSKESAALRLGQGITGWVAFHGRPQLVPDVTADPRYVSMRAAVRCEMAAPMIDDHGQTFGVINVDSDTLAAFAPASLEALIRFTAEASAVMQRLWQLHQLKGKARQLETLITIGQSLVTKLDQQELFETVTRETCKIIQGRACALYLYDPTRKTVRLAALYSPAAVQSSRFKVQGSPVVTDPERSRGASDSQPSTLSSQLPSFSGPHKFDDLPLDSCLVASAFATRKQVEFANIQSPEFLDVIDLPRDAQLHSVLVTPMLVEGDALGALAIFTGHIHRFNNDEKRLAAALASLATVALQNARLYSRVFHSEESLRKNEQLTTLGLLAAEIAHEIRNPLTVIKLLFGALGLEFAASDPRRTDERLIREKLDQLEAIVTRVLNFAKAPASLHSRWSVTDIVTDTLMLVRLKVAQGKIQLRFDPPPRPTIVDVQKGQIQQVLLNLVLNSTQAMPDGGTISVHCESDGHHVFIDVADTGTGIPVEFHGRVFDSFLSGRPDGTGLGLAIAKRIMLSHGGDITLVATSPAGTTMRLTLPLAKN